LVLDRFASSESSVSRRRGGAQALEDCTKSLRYGKLTDALQKQQRLLKQLGKSTTQVS
jgi:hypothetical protein